jgi:hypothetical protein
MPTGPLPDDFAAQLADLLAPGEAEAAAAVIAEAAGLDDERLAGFLERFAARVSRSDEPLTAAELRSLLAPRTAG